MILFLLQMKRPQQLSSRARLLTRPAALQVPLSPSRSCCPSTGSPDLPQKGQEGCSCLPGRYSCPTCSAYITPRPPLGAPWSYEAPATSTVQSPTHWLPTSGMTTIPQPHGSLAEPGLTQMGPPPHAPASAPGSITATPGWLWHCLP